MDPIVRLIKEDGFDWIEFPDELWYNAEFVEWTDGYPWFVRRQ